MQGYQEKNQMQFLFSGFKETLNPQNPLYKLETKIPWQELEEEFSHYYENWGRPAKPTRLMVSLLLLKQLFNVSDERVVELWVENPYWQYLSGEQELKWCEPCEASDLVHFRNRIGEEGIEKIFKMTIKLHGKKALEKQVLIDTTVQEKNITYPTDPKQCVKIIGKCVKIAKDVGVKLRQTYKRTAKKLMFAQRGRNTRNGIKRAQKATRKLKTIAGRLVRELERKLSEGTKKIYEKELSVFKRFLEQKKTDKNKIYSLHEPEVYCISKGKEHKKYEFGSKVSIVATKTSGIIVGAMNHEKNLYDGHTLEEVLEHVTEVRGKRPDTGITDSGYRGRKQIGTTKIVNPDKLKKKKLTKYEKQKIRGQLRRRAGIEPIIGHLKSGYRLSRNYLKGVYGDVINVMLAASAWNLNKLIMEL
ncbi:MAG TPA: IS5 family transposase [Candidatus Portnoybacteria bacterium]|nr:IS5 family transposase [Candidatus Portnoybacteria bacterium]